VWSCLCMFSMWHRHTPCRRSCPILRFPVVWATGSGAWPCGYSLKEGTFPLPNQRRHPPQTPGSRSAFPRGQWGEYAGGFESEDEHGDRSPQKSYKSLKRFKRIFSLSPLTANPSPPLSPNAPSATRLPAAQGADQSWRKVLVLLRPPSACFAGLGDLFWTLAKRSSDNGPD
jgi:hypothetical protein